MTDMLAMMMAGASGIILAAIFFGGLWLTVRKGSLSKRPALWFLGSLLIRMSVVLTGFYFAMGGQWQRSVACLIGFVLGRSIVMRLTKPIDMGQQGPARGMRHAP